ncbi:MAG: hypothetical protein AAGJ31_04945, partial [Verrucomicrobiota bacterium]
EEEGDRATLSVSVEGKGGDVMRFSLQSDPSDSFAEDDLVEVQLPETEPLVALRVGAQETLDPFLHLALQSLHELGVLEIWSIQPEQWPIEGADVVIGDQWVPKDWDAWPEETALLLVNPPSGFGPLQVSPLPVGLPRSAPQVLDANHPVLYRVGRDHSFWQTSELSLPAGMDVLWRVGRSPVLAAGEVEGKRLGVLAFSPEQSSDFPLRPAFPLLIGNFLYWGVENEDESWTRLGGKTGAVQPLQGAEVSWWDRGGNRVGPQPLEISGVASLSRSGRWETDLGERGAAHLLSARESDQAGRDERESLLPPPPTSWHPTEWTSVLLGWVLLILLLESFLFHQRSWY